MDNSIIIEPLIRNLPYKLDTSNSKVFEMIDKISETIVQAELRKGKDIRDIYPIILREVTSFFNDKEAIFSVKEEPKPPVLSNREPEMIYSYQLLSRFSPCKNVKKLDICSINYDIKYNITEHNNVFSFREIKIVDINTSKTIMSDTKKLTMLPGFYYLEDFIEIFNFKINSISGLQFKYFLDWDNVSNTFYLNCNENSVDKTSLYHLYKSSQNKQCSIKVEEDCSMNNDIFHFESIDNFVLISKPNNPLFVKNKKELLDKVIIEVFFDNKSSFISPFNTEMTIIVNGITDINKISLECNFLDIKDCIIKIKSTM